MNTSAEANNEVQFRESEQQGYVYLVFPFSLQTQEKVYFRRLGNGVRGACISIPKSLTKDYNRVETPIYLDGEIDGYKYYTKLLVKDWFYEKNKQELEMYKQGL